MMATHKVMGKFHHASPQSTITVLSPRRFASIGLGSKTKRKINRVQNSSLDSCRVLIIHSLGFGVGSRLWGTLQIRIQFTRQECNTTTPPLNKQTKKLALIVAFISKDICMTTMSFIVKRYVPKLRDFGRRKLPQQWLQSLLCPIQSFQQNLMNMT